LEINGLAEDLVIAYPWTRWFTWLVKWIIRWSYRLADALIVVTPALKESVLEQTGSKPVFVIPNGANTDLFRPDAKGFVSFPEPYALFFGALSSWQGISALLEAVDHLAWPPRVRLVVVGDGVERERVEQAAAQNDRIIYAGPVAYHDMPGVIANCLVSLSPQNSMGNRSFTGVYPLKVFESLACGAPVVVTDLPGQADLIRENRCGIVVPADNPGLLAGAVAWLHDHPEEREQLGENGRQAIAEHHSWDHRADQTAQVLKKVLADPKE
jgi:glycosyltransferase involved in cell wall biosynthesis